MVLRPDTVKTIARGIMNAINDDEIHSESDVEKVIRRSTITENQKKKIGDEIEKTKARLAELEKIAKQ